MKKIFQYISVFCFATFFLASCATGPKVDALYDPGANFAQYKTYNFAPHSVKDKQEYTSILSKYLKQTIAEQMESRGYVRSEKPDLLVNYHVSSKEKIDVDELPAVGAPYYSYRYGYGAWPAYSYETRVKQYQEGTLNIDLIDAQTKQLVWEGVAVGRVKKSAQENLETTINKVVPAVFDKFNYRAGSNQAITKN
ncbi:hypothetical protein TDB9533_02800 [Thalassocella blandensis]|nr:hypothetical protein TDB9533_02800 [Thalassocella blandensis]